MSEVPQIQSIRPFWQGYITGTNRLVALVRFSQQAGGAINGTVLVNDVNFGPGKVSLTGQLNGRRALLQLRSYAGLAPFLPFEGQVDLEFDERLQSAKGTWHTDLGTVGSVAISVANITEAGWKARCLANWMGLNRWFQSPVYALFLVTLGILDSIGQVHLSYPALILVLIPAPHFLRTYLKGMMAVIREAKVKKIGPFEFESEQPLLTEEAKSMLTQEAQKASALVYLDLAFVPRTKAILGWIMSNRTVTRADFESYATAIGVPKENIEVTLQALLQAGCVTVTEEAIQIMPAGEEYVRHLIQANAFQQPQAQRT